VLPLTSAAPLHQDLPVEPMEGGVAVVLPLLEEGDVLRLD